MLDIKNYKFQPQIKLLVVDDSNMNRRFVQNCFVNSNVLIEEAINGQEGIDKTISFDPDIILMDVMMPGIGGFEATEKILEQNRDKIIPIIFLSALDAIDDKIKAFEVGGVDFVTKPFAVLELKARVKNHIDLQKANEQKKHLMKLAMDDRRDTSLKRVSEGISHNFNNLLSVASGNLMLLESGMCDLPDIAMDSVKDIKVSLNRMQDLTKQFLHIAGRSNELGKGTPVLSEVNLGTSVEEIVKNTFLSKGSKVNLITKLKDTKDVLFDKNHLDEIFYLIINETLDVSANKAEIVIYGRNVYNKFRCNIHIKNLEMPPNYQDFVFDPFSLPLANVGAGLSFSVAKQLVELNNSKIKATVKNDNELIFNLILNGVSK